MELKQGILVGEERVVGVLIVPYGIETGFRNESDCLPLVC